MINLLELFGLSLAVLLAYFILKEKNYKLLVFGTTLFPFGIIWESIGVNYAWKYTTPPNTIYSFYLTKDIPLIIPIGWSLSMMLLLFLWQRLNNKNKVSISLLFLIGSIWGTIFELVFVKLGYWSYLIQPQIAGIRPNVPIGWGLLTLSLIYVFELLWGKFGDKIRKNPLYLFVFFGAYIIITPLLAIFMSFVSINLINPLCMATFCS